MEFSSIWKACAHPPARRIRRSPGPRRRQPGDLRPLAGLTPRQVNNWARGRAAVPIWAGILAVVLQDHSPEALTIMLEETAASTLMTEANTDTTGPTETPPPRPGQHISSLKR